MDRHWREQQHRFKSTITSYIIITIFPGLKKKNKVQRKKVKEIAEKYFCDNTGKPITINSTTFDLYRRTENNQPKLEVRELINQFKNG